jgi:hypothetical protein
MPWRNPVGMADSAGIADTVGMAVGAMQAA